MYSIFRYVYFFPEFGLKVPSKVADINHNSDQNLMVPLWKKIKKKKKGFNFWIFLFFISFSLLEDITSEIGRFSSLQALIGSKKVADLEVSLIYLFNQRMCASSMLYNIFSALPGKSSLQLSTLLAYHSFNNGKGFTEFNVRQKMLFTWVFREKKYWWPG